MTTKTAPTLPKRELRSWTIGNTTSQTGKIQSLRFGSTNKGIPQVRLSLEANQEENDPLIIQGIGEIAYIFSKYETSDIITFTSDLRCREYVNKSGQIDFYFHQEIISVP